MKNNIHLVIPRLFLLRMGKVSDKSCRESQNTNFIFNNYFENRAFMRQSGKILYRRTAHR